MCSVVNDRDFAQMRWAIAGASGGGGCIQQAPKPGEMKGDPRAEGLEPLGEPGERTELDGIQKSMTTRT